MRFKLFTKPSSPKPTKTSGRFSNIKKWRPRLPSYFSESILELKKVTWPTRRESWRMTLAVFVFSLVFALLVVVADYGIEIAAKELFL